MSTYNPFASTTSSPSVPTTDSQKISATVSSIKQSNLQTAKMLLSAYNTGYQLVNNSRYTLADSTKLSAAAIYAALDTANATDATVPTSDAEKTIAILVKSLINLLAPGTITDDVPVATITLPSGS